MITHIQDIFPNHEHAPARFYSIQGESGSRVISLDLHDAQSREVDLTDCRALLYIFKSDANVAVIEGRVCDGGIVNRASFTLTLQASSCPGVCEMLLQVFTPESGELRYENMELLVQHAAEMDGLESSSDLGPLRALIQNSGKLEVLLQGNAALINSIREIVQSYTRDGYISETGIFPTEDVEYMPAYDTVGNILLMDTRSYRAEHSRLSTDGGRTWIPAPLQESGVGTSAQFSLCVGGEKFLCLGKQWITWAEYDAGSMRFVTGGTHRNPIATNVNPPAKKGKFLNGKYFVFRTASPSTAYPPAYFNGVGAECVEIELPDSEMIASDVGYDAESGNYYMTGSYLERSPQNRNIWLMRSPDLISWSLVKSWADDCDGARLTIANRKVNVYPCRKTNLVVHSVQIESSGETTFTVPHDGSFYLTDAVSGLYDTVINNAELGLTKDGASFSFLSLNWPSYISGSARAASYGRNIILAKDNMYYIVRVDLAGENIIRELESAKSQYETMVTGLGRLATDFEDVRENIMTADQKIQLAIDAASAANSAAGAAGNAATAANSAAARAETAAEDAAAALLSAATAKDIYDEIAAGMGDLVDDFGGIQEDIQNASDVIRDARAAATTANEAATGADTAAESARTAESQFRADTALINTTWNRVRDIDQTATRANNAAQSAETAANRAAQLTSILESMPTETLEELLNLVNGHVNNASLHMTDAVSAYIQTPYKLLTYIGTGNPSRQTLDLKKNYALIIVMCTMPPAVQDEDGVTHQYWDYWMEKRTGDKIPFGGGGVVYSNENGGLSFYNKESEKVENVQLHLNDSGMQYVCIMIPKIAS